MPIIPAIFAICCSRGDRSGMGEPLRSCSDGDWRAVAGSPYSTARKSTDARARTRCRHEENAPSSAMTRYADRLTITPSPATWTIATDGASAIFRATSYRAFRRFRAACSNDIRYRSVPHRLLPFVSRSSAKGISKKSVDSRRSTISWWMFVSLSGASISPRQGEPSVRLKSRSITRRSSPMANVAIRDAGAGHGRDLAPTAASD